MGRYINTTELLWIYEHECEKYSDLEELVADVPTADVQEVRHGKWEVYGMLDYAQKPTGRKVLRCSFCGYFTDDLRSIVDCSKMKTHYCPNCGAKMDL